MEQVSVVGLNLAKSVFQGHGVNAQGEAVLRRRLTRGKLLKLMAAFSNSEAASRLPRSQSRHSSSLRAIRVPEEFCTQEGMASF